jgi:AmmeMemoRadiSam system protein B/AmmeMemoRadiSam system protein A
MATFRQPAVSGLFYPKEKRQLEEQILSFLKKAKKEDLGKPKILIVPHAGIVYSGQTAAFGFKQVEGEDFKRVVLLGASHTSWFSYAAVDDSDFWLTPLGQVALDKDFIDFLTDGKYIVKDKRPFINEHCLEMELIFLQKVLTDFTIVPILLSEADDFLIEKLAEKIASKIDDKTLVVVSSDLSHYPPDEVAKKTDQKTIEAILLGEREIFEKKIFEIENSGLLGLETAACGQKAISLALALAKRLGVYFKLIHYSNSADVSLDFSRVVGYAAIGGYLKQNKDDENFFLDEKVQKEALKIVKNTLKSFLTRRTIPKIKVKSKSLFKKLGCFVTLKKNGKLRGCIGEFPSDKPLWQVIQKTALASAFDDPRFFPLKKEELRGLEIEISIVFPLKKIDDWQKIKLGMDGVLIEKEGRRGVFLPQVAKETGWSLEEFLGNLCLEKAGLPKDCYKDPKTNIYVFKVQSFLGKVEERE